MARERFPEHDLEPSHGHGHEHEHDNDDVFPLSFAQQRMWFLEELDPGAAIYNLGGAVRLRGRLDVSAFEKAVEALVERHETLRTVIRTEAGVPVQAVSPRARVTLERVDLTGTSTDMTADIAEAEAEARRIATRDNRTPFDLARGPLLRTKLLRLDDEDHVLVLAMHHIISDAWSVGVFFRELGLLYHLFSRGEPSPLAELAIQYADFAHWQRSLLKGDALETHLDYWRRKLDSAAVLELPTDRARPPVQSFKGASTSLELSETLTAGLKELARRERATLFMTFWAALACLFGRYSGQSDVVMGAAVAGRNRRELEGLIGLFVNTLVLRCDLSGDPTFRELLGRCRQVALEAYEHQDLPFEKLVEALHPERRLSRNPLFQVMFGFQNVPELPGGLEGIVFEEFPIERNVSRFDMTLFVTERVERLSCSLEYATDLFDADRVERMLRHLEALLAAAVRRPDERLSELSLLTEDERSCLIESSQRDAAFEARLKGALDDEDSLSLRFERAAASRPDAVALTLGGEPGGVNENVNVSVRMSYDELNRAANRLARHLVSLGVGSEDRVGICLPRSLDMVTALLAVTKAGAGYVPMDPGYPDERLRFLLADSGASVLVTRESERGKFGTAGASAAMVIVSLDEHRERIAAHDDGNLDPRACKDALAYVIYTSGSTGTPKGVLVTHENVLRLFDSTRAWFEPGPEDVWTLFHSYAFDFSVWEMWGALLHGGRLVVVPHWVSRSPADFEALLRGEGVTVLSQTPSAFRQLAHQMGSERTELRYIVFGGEALEPGDWRPWVELQGDRSPTLVNMYGITETTVHVTHRVLERADLESGVSPIGRPLPDLELYLLDPGLESVPFGVAGEIFVGGPGLARGYLNRPDITAERFVPHPFAKRPGERLYRSGDLARMLPSGELLYLGRADHQVKLRGFRIELGEIESALEGDEHVESAVAVMSPGPSGEPRIVAYVVPDRKLAHHVRERVRLESAGELEPAERFELPDGRVVAQLNRSETEFMVREIFERRTYERPEFELEEGAVVLDVGANIGLFSLYVSDRIPDVTVHAFEPVPEAFRALEKNQALHGFKGVLHRVGLGERTGREEFVYYPNASVLSGRFADAAEERRVVERFIRNEGASGEGEREGERELLSELLEQRLEQRKFEAEVKTLSDVLREQGLSRIDLLKVDVEKSELEVLRGIRDEDWGAIRQIIAEVHDEGSRLEIITKLLEAKGFRVWIEEDETLRGTGLKNVYASRRDGEVRGATAAAEARASAVRSPSELVERLRSALGRKLPEYMVPSSFVVIPELPLTAHGKLDRAALPDPRAQKTGTAGSDAVAPRNEAERVLAEIWCDVLGLDEVGVENNFFEVGGDSIASIQVVSRAREKGWRISPRDVFRYQTLGELARAAVSSAVAVGEATASAEKVLPPSGDVPLTPIQKWFFELELEDPHHFNHAVLLDVLDTAGLGHLEASARMREVIRRVARRHDAFRLRFVSPGTGATERYAEDAGVDLAVVDLASVTSPRAREALQVAAAAVQMSFDLAKGPLLRAVWFHLGEEEGSRLLLVCHHLVVDGVSWRILLDELERGLEAALLGERWESGADVAHETYAAWAEALRAYASSDALRAELPYWRKVATAAVQKLPVDRDSGRPFDRFGDSGWVPSVLDRESTEALFELPRVNRVQGLHVLLTALLRAVARWSGARRLRLDVETHGREDLGFGSFSGTVGWLTSIYPLVLEHEPGVRIESLLQSVKERVEEVPNHGIGFGLLRYLSSFEDASALRSMIAPEIGFNYHGRFESAGESARRLRASADGLSLGSPRSPRSRRLHPLEVNALVRDRELRIDWTFSSPSYDEATVAELARDTLENLRALIGRLRESGEAVYSGADFGARLTSGGLEKALGQVEFE